MSASQVPTLQVDYSEMLPDAAQVGTMGGYADSMTGLTNARAAYGFTGKGQTVAVIDTGIAYDHPALGGGFGAGYRVVGGYDFAENDTNPYDDGPAGSHGTHVAGIIGSTDSVSNGVAPGVDLVSLRVFDDNGNGMFSWVDQALQWVHQHRNDFANPITAVNLSLGTAYNGNTIPNWAMLETDFAQLESDGIFVAVAAGNGFTSYNTPGLSYPAVSSHVIPVAAVDSTGSLAYYSQRNDRVIAAPGSGIRSTVPDYVGNLNGKTDDFATYSGTSMASPYVAGASTLIRQAMQFAGQTNITEWQIYNVMRNTADAIYDTATSATYKRLNLQRAIDSVMPADEFGSDANSAYSMGTLNTTVSINGAIAKLTDKDYFKFTAGSDGAVTFKVTARDSLTPQFDAGTTGGTISADGKSITFNVQAGQSYTFGFGTSNGLGHYTLDGTLRASLSGLGTVDFKELKNLQVAGGEQWFSVTAKRSGTFTVESMFANASGNIDLEVYNGNRQLLASSATTNNGERVDITVNAGDVIMVRAVGNNDHVDFRLTNLVQQSGSTVTVFGTANADTFTFTAGTTQQVNINGTGYQFASAAVNNIVFNGNGGTDAARYYLGTGAEQITLRPGTADILGSGYQTHASGVASFFVNGGGGADVAALYGNGGQDVLTARPGNVVLAGSGYRDEVNGVPTVNAVAGAGGSDIAYLYGSTGNDIFSARLTGSQIQGSGYSNFAGGFGTVIAYSNGGNDIANLYDSAGNDVFTSRPTQSTMQGNGFVFQANNFASVYAYSTGGQDTANMYDSAGNDVFTLKPDSATMQGNGFLCQAKNFKIVNAYSTGGTDQANIYDSIGNDSLIAQRGRVSITNSQVTATMYGFKRVTAYGTAGGRNTAQVSALDYVFSKVGKW